MYWLTILTPEELIYEGEVSSLIAPGTVGYLQILTNHAPIITTLKPGEVTIADKNGTKITYRVSGGVLEVNHNNARLFADSIQS